MRKLAYFSFSFAFGALLSVLGFPALLRRILFAVLALLLLAGLILKGRRERAAAILAAGALFGLLRAETYRVFYLNPAETVTSEQCDFSLELTEYPTESHYGGVRVTGVVTCGETRFRARIHLQKYDGALKPGDCICGNGWLKPADGGEDGSYYYRSIGIPMQGGFRGEVTVEHAETLPLRALPAYLAHRLRAQIAALFPQDVQGYLLALLTGDKSGLSYQQKSDLRISGIYHALAVSGMHVVILMSILSALTARRQRLYPLLGIPILCFYCIMVGGMASVVRAAVMQGFLMLGPVVRREPDTPTSLGASLLVLTVQNPWCLLNTGMQLSYLATVGLVAFHSRLNGFFLRKAPKKRVAAAIYRAIAGVTASTLSALSLTLPLMAWYFGSISLIAVLTNLLALRAITWSFFLGFLAVGLGFLSTAAAAAPAWCAALLLRYLAWITEKLARLPFAAGYLQKPYLGFWLLFCYAAFLLLLILRPKFGKRLVLTSVSCTLVTFCVCLLFSWGDGDGTFAFSMLDVGQGQCLLYRSGGQTAVVDCGGSYGDAAGDLLAETLLADGQSHLDYLIFTHYDEDHTGGARQLFHRLPVDVLILPDIDEGNATREELLRLAQEQGTEVRFARQDLTIFFGAGELRVFAPEPGVNGNEGSLCVWMRMGEYDILATGDLPVSQEKWLLTSHTLPDCEVLVAGHHGSSGSTSSVLLARTKPELVLISVGENSYGHPAAETLERITEAGAQSYRTDQCGTITIRR